MIITLIPADDIKHKEINFTSLDWYKNMDMVTLFQLS